MGSATDACKAWSDLGFFTYELNLCIINTFVSESSVKCIPKYMQGFGLCFRLEDTSKTAKHICNEMGVVSVTEYLVDGTSITAINTMV